MTKKTIVTVVVSMVAGVALFMGYSYVHVWHGEAKAYEKAVAQYQAQQQKTAQAPVSVPAPVVTK